VNVDELFKTIDAVKKAPVIGAFKFRATTNGSRADTTAPPFETSMELSRNTNVINPLSCMRMSRPFFWGKTAPPIRWSTF